MVDGIDGENTLSLRTRGLSLVVEGDVFCPHASSIVDSLERRIIFQLGLSVYYSDQT